jgi:hypothetical protein
VRVKDMFWCCHKYSSVNELVTEYVLEGGL